MDEKCNKHDSRETSNTNTTAPYEIVEVWDDNLDEEIERIAALVGEYRFVGMDTEFPGICIQNERLEGYGLIKANVDVLKLIQVGVSIADEHGRTPPNAPTTWQFNLAFDLKKDKHSMDSISMLKEAGIKFEEHARRGIHPLRFAEELISSGLYMNEEIFWITFHGAFDFGYLLRNASNQALPADFQEFIALMKVYFPNIYDTKVMLKEVSELRNGSLAKLALDLDQKPIGTNHQAGSDAELTLRCFFRLREKFFPKKLPQALLGHVYGLAHSGVSGNVPVPAKQPQAFPPPMDATGYSELNQMNLLHQYMVQQPVAYARAPIPAPGMLQPHAAAGLQNFRPASNQYYYQPAFEPFQPMPFPASVATFNSLAH